jgi:asparagine synthase (glutamine-hydrolysing)
MNALAVLYGASEQHPARAAATVMLERMGPRAARHRIVVAETSAVLAVAGRSPGFSNKPEHAVLVGDIRLANRRELQGTLGLAADATDAVIALEAFTRWGIDFANHLAGDFALVIVDRQASRLLAVRDPLGIRPLYYRSGTSHVRVASELRALVEPGDRPDEGFLAEVLAGDIVDLEATPYASVRRVPAAHVLIADASGTTIRRYWQRDAEPAERSQAQHAERFLAAFDEAVRACCEGHATVGVHLSGGLDAGAVLGTISVHQFAEVIPGAVLLPWREADRRNLAEAVSRRWMVPPVLIEPPMEPAETDLSAIASHRDLPDFPTGRPLIAPLLDAMRMRQAGAVLTAAGGHGWIAGSVAQPSVRRPSISKSPASRGWRRASDAMRRFAKQLVPQEPPPWIDGAFAERTGLAERLAAGAASPAAPSQSWNHLRSWLDSGDEALARERLDRLAVASDVELRHPFYDRRLLDVVFSMPETSHRNEGPAGRMLRDAMKDRVPADLLAAADPPDLSNVLLAAARSPDVEPHLTVPMLAGLGWVDRAEVANLVTRARNRSDPAAALPFWQVIGIEAWLKEVFGAT